MKQCGFAAAAALAVALVLGSCLATLSAAANRRADVQVRRTFSCTTELGALQLTAFATNPTIGSANVTVSTGDPNQATGLLGVSSEQKHYGLGSRCHSVVRHVVLSRRGLTSAGVVHAGDVRSPTVYCSATRRVLMRLLITYNDSGKPVSATIEVVTEPKRNRKSKRIGFVQWSPKKSVTYYSSRCTSQY
jgi:hypothetical protein